MTRGPANLQTTVRDLARAFSVSERAIYTAGKVRRLGVPELVQLVEAGLANLHEADRVCQLPADVQRDLVARVQAGALTRLRQGLPQRPTRSPATCPHCGRGIAGAA